MSVRVKLISALTTILVGAFVSLSIFNYNVSRQNAREETVNSALPLTRDNIYSEIQTALMRPLFVSSLMANDTFLKDWAKFGEKDVFQVMRYLEEIQKKYGFFSAFYVSALSSDYYYSQGILKTVSKQDSHDVWFYDFIQSGEMYDLVVDTNEASENVLTIFINHRVEDPEGKLLGVTGVGLKMDKVSRLLKTFSEKYSKIIFLVDPAGTVQAHHEIDQVFHTNIRSISGLADIADDVLASDRSEPATFECVIDGERTYLTSRYIPELEWFLIVEAREKDILGSARINFINTLLIGGFVTFAIVLLSIFVINYFQIRLEKQANTDELTGVANRRAFECRFDSATRQYRKTGKFFSIALLDIDGFKQVNDCWGHIVGDRILQDISALISSSIRESDFCARWGGDEFILLVDGDIAQGVAIAERIRLQVEQFKSLKESCYEGIEKINITVSCGVAEFSKKDTLDTLTARADKAMYLSKEQGKNRVVKD